MPFISKDWRSPGEEWVKTDQGWEKKKVLECVSVQTTRSPRTSTSSQEDCSDTPPSNWCCEDKENMVPPTSQTTLSTEESSSPALPPHCFIVIKSTREIAGFNGLSDALKRLDFRRAVHDDRRFNYICKLLDILLCDKLAALSGCAQKVLFNVLEQVAYQVSTSGKKPEVLRKLLIQLQSLVDCACWGHPLGSTSLWLHHLETINRISNMADTLTFSLTQGEGEPNLVELPEECVREVMLRLSDHKDLEALGSVSDVTRCLLHETRIWRELTHFHFTPLQIDAARSLLPHPHTYIDLFHLLRKKHGLREEYAEMLHLCRVCRCLFWGTSGHPCAVQTDNTQEHHIPLPPHAFLNFFSL